MQSKDIPDTPVLQFLASLDTWGTWFAGLPNSVQQAMPAEVPGKLVHSKMRALIRRQLVDGCVCGCRGDFELTQKGRDYLAAQSTTPAQLPAP
jgi:hypothetical protein